MTAPLTLRVDLDNPTPQQQYYRDLSFAEAFGDEDALEQLLAQGIPPAQKRDGYTGVLAAEGRGFPGEPVGGHGDRA
ncbi:hypothetical protein ACFXG4_30315 [Nocardia sp. NPDC059246]|uniref:hypothetical protein n=1 Tax=unclassified Nocardia TaxID=2637762 RepID=UPI0036831907